jgi:hypothetical protein
VSIALRCCALACVLASLTHACTDPGCIRNSECQANFRCIEAACVRPGSDAGVVRGDTPTPTIPANEDAGIE